MHRVDVAVVYRSSFTLAGDYSREDAEGGLTEGNFEYKYPDAIAVGLEYHPRNEMMTSVSFDMIYTRWSEFESDFASDLGFDDTIEYRAGVEHQFFDNTQARFGFVYQPSYFDEHTSRTAFCFGLGLDVLGARVDIGGQMGVREYGIEEGRLRETTSIGTVTLSHTF
jgi:long-subunit fatty acid transport protein